MLNFSRTACYTRVSLKKEKFSLYQGTTAKVRLKNDWEPFFVVGDCGYLGTFWDIQRNRRAMEGTVHLPQSC